MCEHRRVAKVTDIAERLSPLKAELCLAPNRFTRFSCFTRFTCFSCFMKRASFEKMKQAQ